VSSAASIRSARRRTCIGCLAAVSLLALALPVPASAETFLGSFNLPLDGSKLYSAPLVAGGVYRIAASGTYTQSGGPASPVERDALYCFNYVASPPAGCSPSMPVRQYPVAVLYEGNTSPTADLDALNPATTLAYNPLHTYQETFTAASSTRLEISCRMCNPFYSFSGGIRLDLYLVSLPPAPGAGGGGSGGGRVRKILEPAVAWGNPSPETAIAPGDWVTVSSPSIGPRQREATVIVRGARPNEIAVSARTRARQCVTAFLESFEAQNVYSVGRVTGTLTITNLNKNPDAVLPLLEFLACIEALAEADARPAKPSVAAAASGCRRRAARVDVQVNRASKTARFTVRPSRRGPSRRRSQPLLISCRQTRDGALILRIRARSRRGKLRKLVGRRLVAGVYRSREARGTAKVRATFTRR